MRFISKNQAVFLPEIDSIVISDLHIGLEHELIKSGIVIPSQAERMEKRILKLIKMTNAKRLVILGDVKHQVPGISWREEKQIPSFLSTLSKVVEIHITLGNHDPSLTKLIEGTNVSVHSAKGFRIGDFGFFHGHAWPSRELLECKTVFMGHVHPAVELKDRFGYRTVIQVWVITRISKDIGKKYGLAVKRDVKLIVVPAFNRLIGACVLNSKREEELLGPLLRSEFVDMKNSKVYTLDGIELGTLGELRFK